MPLSLLFLLLSSLAANAQVVDDDADGVYDFRDNCLGLANADQRDGDLDGFGNACDGDFNNDNAVGLDDVGEAIAALNKPDSVRDLNGDGAVGIDDVGTMLGWINQPPGPSGVACAGTVPCISCSFGVGSDTDGDMVDDDIDNCLLVENGPAETPNNQFDGDSPPDGFGNICDGDFDQSGSIDINDRYYIENHLGQPDPTDLHADGFMDLADLSYFTVTWPNALFPGTFFPGPSGTICESTPGTGIPLAPDFPAVSATGALTVLVQPGGAPYQGSLNEQAATYAVPLTYAVLSQPQSGRIVVEDATSGSFRFEPDPNSDILTDHFSWVLTDGHALSQVQKVTLLIQRPADGAFTPTDLSASTLVVYNENAADALELATYYANARGIDPQQICGVQMPNGLYATKDQMLSMRSQIIEDCVCPLIPAGEQPVPCAVGPNLDAIAEASPISHLALIKGLPARMHDTGWPNFGNSNTGDAGEPSLDFYLSYLLYRDEDIFCTLCPGPAVNQFVDSVYDGDVLQSDHYPPPIRPGDHRVVAYGRIEAMDTTRTEYLIDRTLEAEAAGLKGKVIVNDGNTSPISPAPPVIGPLFALAMSSTGSSDDVCVDYMVTPPLMPWPHESCRVGTNASTVDPTKSLLLPGTEGTHIETAIDAGLFFGNYMGPNAYQHGFYTFDTMLKWHKSEETCTELCEDMPDATSEAACVAASTDYFKELNTDCVGVAPGFIGAQFRSYPVGYYGFYPSGWRFANNGQQESTPPVVLTGGGYQDGSTFTDDQYLHFGAHDVTTPDSSMCKKLDGTSEPCPEEVVLFLRHRAFTSFPLSENRSFELRLRHRNRASPGGELRFRAIPEFDDGSYASPGNGYLDLSEATPGADWQTGSVVATVPPNPSGTVILIDFYLEISLAHPMNEFFDLDGVEIIDLTTGQPLLPADLGGFARTDHHQTVLGDWAANAIDRLGGIAFWGSSSHHMTGGAGFLHHDRIYRNLLSGRSLGESVLSAGNGESGIIYGDPLYRPVAAVLASTEPVSSYKPWPSGTLYQHPGLRVTSENLASARWLTMSVLHGTTNLWTVQWSLATCPQLDLQACDAGGLWVTQQTGTGSVKEHPFDWTAFIDTQVDQPVVVRLKVENPGEPDLALYDYAFFDYEVNGS